MRAHIADGAATPIDPTAPIEGMVDGVIRDGGADTQKEIPRESLGNGIVASHSRGETGIDTGLVPLQSFEFGGGSGFGAGDALRPETDGAIRPDVNFADFADGTSPTPFNALAAIVKRCPLIPNLGGEFFFGPFFG